MGYLTEYVEESMQPDVEMLSPEPGTKLGEPTVTFEWDPVEEAEYHYLKVGSTTNADDILGQYQGDKTSATVTGIPLDGRTIYVRMFARVKGKLFHNDFTYGTEIKQLPCVGTVKLTNLTRGGAEIYAGDQIQVDVSGPPEQIVAMKTSVDGGKTSNLRGHTDAMGNRVVKTTMTEEHLGKHRQTWTVGGRCLDPPLEFEVLPAP